ncbi:MAG: hypothetical protein ABJB40_12445, partial [Acidobacteriota bacterium]
MTRKIKGLKDGIGILFFLLVTAFGSGCGANDSILRSGKETPAPADANSQKTPIIKDIESMKTAGFTFIYVVRRKDGGVIDAAD